WRDWHFLKCLLKSRAAPAVAAHPPPREAPTAFLRCMAKAGARARLPEPMDTKGVSRGGPTPCPPKNQNAVSLYTRTSHPHVARTQALGFGQRGGFHDSCR